MNTLFDGAVPHPGGYRDVDVRQLSAHPVPWLVDVREPSEFDGILGHIDGARLVPLATVKDSAASWPKDQDVVLVCRSGARSGKAAEQLVKLGFTRVMNLRGGMLAWNTADLPVVRPPLAAPPTLAQVRDVLLAGLHRAVAPGALAPDRGPSREALTALLDALQASGFEPLVRESRDLLAVARPEGGGR